MSDTPRTDARILEVMSLAGLLQDKLQMQVINTALPWQFARQLERELNAICATITEIYYDTEGYADGAPDASHHDKLCNEVSSKLKPFVTRKQH